MARRFILNDDGINNLPNTPTGYKFIGYDGEVISQKSGATVSAIGSSSSPTELITNISSAQLLNIFSTPVEILPAPGAGMYYKYTAILEYEYNTAIYTASGAGALYLDQGSADVYFDNNTIKQTFDTASFGTAYGHAKMNTAVNLTSASNPTLGDGTCKLKIWYTIETFGS